jgi:hypothetical protein
MHFMPGIKQRPTSGTKSKKEKYMSALITILGFGWVIAAWITHVVVCLKTASWGFLVAGALLFPIAWIHGTGIWFGWF